MVQIRATGRRGQPRSKSWSSCTHVPLGLLSQSSPYLPESLVDEIERLAHDSTKAALPVRVERSDGTLVIDALNVPG